ncbi:MAG: FAD-dependent oxidoreductase [Paracoccaceae bacterium]|nr:FAD-dependent oxidoreductase [Paracoccaceae bacterium]
MSGILIIGAGQAGVSLAARLRSLGYSGALTLIGEEPVLPYQRPPLSKGYLLGDMPLDRMFLRPRSWYTDLDIDLKLGTPVARIDRAARAIHLGGGTIGYDQLALTTGAIPRRLPTEIGGALRGTYVIRGLADIDAVKHEFHAGRRALIIGGGYIGLEAAAVAAKLGLTVTLNEASDRLLQRVASPQTAAHFRAMHQAHGVDIREGVAVKALLGKEVVTGALLSDGSTVAADFVMVGIGVTPATALAEAAGLAIDNGIRTDAEGRTSDPAIWAAGDCASFPWRNGRLRLESVGNAVDQAEAVAANMLGAASPYQASPWFWSDQYDAKLQIAGLSTGYDQVVARAGASGGVSFWYLADGHLLAVDAINDPRAFMAAKKLLGVNLSPHLGDIEDANFDLRKLLS